MSVPNSWKKEDDNGQAEEGASIRPIECTSWKQLITSWRKALKWTEGLDRAMAVMLASVQVQKP